MTLSTIRTEGTQGRLTGRKVFLMFLAFFGTIAAADALLVTSALRTWSGLEVRSPYEAGRHYDSEIGEAREQAARGWAVEWDAKRVGGDALTVTVTARDRTGSPLHGLVGRASVERPTDKRLDRGGALAETSPGTYGGTISGVPAGQWDLVIDLFAQGKRLHRRRARVLLP